MSSQNTQTLDPSPVPRGITAKQPRTGLYVLCYRCLPDHHKIIPSLSGEEWRGLDVAKIAEEIGVSKQKVSAWFKQNSLPGQRVAAMVGLKNSTLTFEKLGPFITSR